MDKSDIWIKEYEWFHDDQTWCGNECSNTACERNITNRLTHGGLMSIAMFRNTDTCPLYRLEHSIDEKPSDEEWYYEK